MEFEKLMVLASPAKDETLKLIETWKLELKGEQQ